MSPQPSTPIQRHTAAEPVSPLTLITTEPPNVAGRGPTSPVRFAATTNAFGLSASPLSSGPSAGLPPAFTSASTFASTSRQPYAPLISTSPTSAGTAPTRRLRRPSMLSLAQTPAEVRNVNRPPSDERMDTGLLGVPASSERELDFERDNGRRELPPEPPSPFQAPEPRWGTFPPQMRRVSSAPPLPLDSLTTSTPPMGGDQRLDDGGDAGADADADMGEPSRSPRPPPKWLPSHLQPSRGAPGRMIPGALLATLISEEAPLEHEMRSEARLQRLLASHPSALPFTPRQRRSTRGRFPEMFEDDDDDDGPRPGMWAATGGAPRRLGMQRWRAPSSDDTDDDDDDWPSGTGAAGAVNSDFASAMDMDRPVSSSSSSTWGAFPARSDADSGKSTPGQARSASGSGSVDAAGATTPAHGTGVGGGSNGHGIHPTPPSNTAPWPRSARMSLGMVPSPGMQLPTAFGGLGMGGGIGTPLGSPTVEKLELATSPGMSLSPGMMQYREARPGKRKANDDRFDPRFDPYKRPRGSSPSPFPSQSPSRPTIPIPSSPSTHPSFAGLAYRQSKAYARPARSRAASPALSIGSTSGVLSTSLTSLSGVPGPNGRPLGGAFIPTGPGASAAVTAAGQAGQAPQGLGGLGLLSLAHEGERRTSDPESIEMIKEDSNESIGSLGMAGRMEQD
ncbi:hypothetical protein Q5752_006390 [Cryptotrichosporon argae]